MKTLSQRLTITLVALLLGVLLMAQFAAQQRVDTQRASASSADGALLISNLVEGNARLRQEVAELDAQLDTLRGATSQARLQTMTDELERLRIMNGEVQVSGPGVQVTFDGPASALDLQDLLNELRNAGAEVVAVNGRRIVASSVIVPAPDGSLNVDNTLIQRPYQFAAIGDPVTLETALLRPGGLLAVFANSREALNVGVQRHDRLTLPVHTSFQSFQYAVSVK